MRFGCRWTSSVAVDTQLDAFHPVLPACPSAVSNARPIFSGTNKSIHPTSPTRQNNDHVHARTSKATHGSDISKCEKDELVNGLTAPAQTPVRTRRQEPNKALVERALLGPPTTGLPLPPRVKLKGNSWEDLKFHHPSPTSQQNVLHLPRHTWAAGRARQAPLLPTMIPSK